MAAINFPNSPNDNDTFFANGIFYVYDDTKDVWKVFETGSNFSLNDAQTLEGDAGSFYLNFNNFTNTNNLALLATGVDQTFTGNININGVFSPGVFSPGNLITSGQVLATGNVSGGNLITSGQVLATGNVSGGNLNTAGSITATGSILGNSLIAISVVIAGNANIAGNVNIAEDCNASNLTVISITATSNITGANIIGTLNGSGANVSSINATNISSGTLAQDRLANAAVTLGSTALTLGNTVTTVAGLTSVTSTTFVGDLTGAATTAGTVTTAAQPNITSVGSLGNTEINSLGIGTAASGTAGEIRATNNITAFFSDRRLKKITGTIPDAIGKIMSLSGIQFVNNEVAVKHGYTSQQAQVGVIAQEVQRVLPEAVVPAPFDIATDVNGKEISRTGENYLAVQYEKIIPLLIEAIKQQQFMIQELQRKSD